MITEARFVWASGRPADLPPPTMLEVAVAGRSNCGKSTLINAVTGQHKLARTSSTPGRTQQIIAFLVSLAGGAAKQFYLVDLPGYGYARASRNQQAAWAHLVTSYIETRATLRGMLVLNDIRRQPGQEEHDLLHWLEQREIPVLVVLTKADKLSKSQRFAAVQQAKLGLGLKRRPLAFSVRDLEAVEAVREGLLDLMKS